MRGRHRAARLSGRWRGVEAVVFDVGETLVSEERVWASWAEWLEVPPYLLFSCLGATIGARGPHQQLFDLLLPGFDPERLAAEEAAREAAGRDWRLAPADLYADAAPALAQISEAGYLVGVAGNQPLRIEAPLRELGLATSFVVSSEGLGAHKPDPAFFERVAELAGCPPQRVAYVGDRVDNDVLPSIAAGMVGVLLRRGPWGFVHASWPEASRADLVVGSLAELADLLAPAP